MNVVSDDLTSASAPRIRSAGARIVRNILALSVGQALTWLSAAALAVLLPRYLDDVGLGKLSIAFAFVELFGLFTSLGIGTYLTKEVARSGTAARAMVLNALLMRLPLALVVGTIAALSASLMGYDQLTRELIYLYAVSILLSAVGGVLVGALYGLQELRAAALVSSASKGALLPLIVLFIWLDYGPLGVALAWNLSNAVAVVGYLAMVLRRGALGGRPAPRTWPQLLRGGLPYFTWEAALLVYGRIDVVLLSVFTSAAVIGWYGAAYRVITIPGFIPSIIMTAAFPALLSASGQDRAAFNGIARRALQVVLLATTPIALGSIVLADKFIGLLGYPAEYSRSVPLIAILALHIPIVGTDMIIGSALNALDKQRQWAITGVAAAVLNPALNMALIPLTDAAYGNGAVGSAIVTVMTEAFMLGMGLWLLKGTVFDRSDLAAGLKCVAAGVVMVGVVWLVRDLYLPIVIAVGAGVYFTASLAVGTISIQDIRLLHIYVLQRGAARAEAA